MPVALVPKLSILLSMRKYAKTRGLRDDEKEKRAHRALVDEFIIHHFERDFAPRLRALLNEISELSHACCCLIVGLDTNVCE